MGQLAFRRLALVFAPILLGLVVIAPVPSSAQTTRYVLTNGNDSNDGLQPIPSRAKRTVKGAIAVSANGDIIEIANGNYTESFDLLNKNLTIRRYAGGGPGTVTFQGQAAPVVYISGGQTSQTVIQDLIITGGTATRGGGIYIRNSSPTIRNCIIENNTASGAAGDAGGGGLFLDASAPRIVNCIIRNNTSPGEGGGIHCFNTSKPEIVNTLIYGNTAPFGAGIRSFYSSAPNIVNSTIANNNGIGLFVISGSPVVTNSIIWGNSGGDIVNQTGGAPIVTYSNIGGISVYSGTGNINSNPRFVNSAGGDYQLQPSSLCIDAGNSAAFNLSLTNVDLAGNSRRTDIACVTDTGAGTLPIIDLGAYEVQSGSTGNVSVPNDIPTIQHAIQVVCPGSTITLASGTFSGNLTVNKDVTIQGSPAGSIIQPSATGSVVTIAGGATVTLNDLTIQSGTATSGGGITNNGNLTLNRVLLRNNSAQTGGAIFTQSGSLVATNTTFSGNTATGGANPRGSAVFVDGTASVTLRHCTITSNSAGGTGVVVRQAGTLTLQSTIVAANGGGTDVTGAVVSQGTNLIGNAGASTGWVTSDQRGTAGSPLNPMLASLQPNGGPTLTHAPVLGSPAVDKANPASFPTTDQRGILRPFDGDLNGSTLPDVGAVENNTTLTASLASTTPSCPEGSSGTATLSIAGGLAAGSTITLPTYCIPPPATWSQCTSNTRINSVTVTGGISNTTNACSPNGYQYFQNQVAVWPTGSSQTITANVGTGGGINIVSAKWVDWNQDGDFGDEGEFIYSAGGSFFPNRVANITVPATAQSGMTRLRVMSRAYEDILADQYCFMADHQGGLGVETEDYPVLITGGNDYQILWSNGQTGKTLVNVPPGTYSAVVTAGNNQQVTINNVVIGALPAVVADAGPDTQTCPNELISIGGSPTGSGGTGNLTYNWLVNGQPYPASSVDQQQLSMTISDGGPYQQSFTVGQTGELRAIEVGIAHGGSLSGTFILDRGELFEYGERLVNRPFTSTTPNSTLLTLDCPIPVVAGEKFTIRVYGIFGYGYRTDNPYAGGQSSKGANADNVFKTFVGPKTGICGGPNIPNPKIITDTTTSYTVVVTDQQGCSASDTMTVTILPEPCVKLTGFSYSPEMPYSMGQVVQAGVNLNLPAPAGGLNVDVTTDAHEDTTIFIPEGQTSASVPVTIQQLGENMPVSARIQGRGGIIIGALSAFPVINSVTMDGTSFFTGDLVNVTITLDHPALSGGALINLYNPQLAFDPVNVEIPEGETTVTTQVLMVRNGSGLITRASWMERCRGIVYSAPFDVLSQIIYVNGTGGSDITGNGSYASPFQTIQKGIDTAPAGGTVVIAPGIYNENLSIGKSLSLAGSNYQDTIIDGQQLDRVILIYQGDVTLSRLTIRNGRADDVDEGYFGFGGGIRFSNYGVWSSDLTINECYITGNHAEVQGGGIYADYYTNVRIWKTTIAGNTAGFDGGGFAEYGALSVDILNSTISGNTAGLTTWAFGGGVYIATASAFINHCTITNNTSSDPVGNGVAFYATVKNSIISGNGTNGLDMTGEFTSQGYNILGSNFFFNLGTGDIRTNNPGLTGLTTWGNGPPLHGLQPDSPAINAASPVSDFSEDQRGEPRPLDAGTGEDRSDIGAFEQNDSAISTPVIANPAPGQYQSGVNITLATLKEGAVIRYTTDGTDPDDNSTLYTGPIVLSQANTNIKARSFKTGYIPGQVFSGSYTLKVATPQASPNPASSYTNPINATLTSATAGASIYYTLDGSEPTEASTLYTGPIAITQVTTVKARAYKAGLPPSDIMTAQYNLVVTTVSITPDGRHFQVPTVEITMANSTPGSLIYYTLDGTFPTQASTLYTGPFILDKSATIRVRAFLPNWIPSSETIREYRLRETRYVAMDGNDANDGKSWATAKRTIQAAFADVLSSDHVWIKAGTYKVTEGTDRGARFEVPVFNLQLLGGFAGTESTPGERNIAANPTILSGDIGVQGDNSDNAYNVLRIPPGTSVFMEGITIEGANNTDPTAGGGILVGGGSITAYTSRIVNNSSIHDGGGVRVTSGVASFIGCYFANNTAQYGGAIHSSGATNIRNSIFVNNSAVQGGAVKSSLGSMSVYTSTFYDNKAPGGSGAVGFARSAPIAFRNIIAWNSTGSHFGIASGSYSVANSIVEGGHSGSGNLSDDPMFVDPANGDFRLMWGSPAYNAGDNTFVTTATDFAGNPRIMGGIVDIGAYELPPLASSILEAKQSINGTEVNIPAAIVTVNHQGAGVAYVQNEARTVGIRVEGPTQLLSVGQRISIIGVMATRPGGERYIAASTLNIVNAGDRPRAYKTITSAIGGADFLYNDQYGNGQRGVTGGAGLNNVGLLMKTSGTVVSVNDQPGNSYFVVQDGSQLTPVRVNMPPGALTMPYVGEHVTVTGASSIHFENGTRNRLIVPHDQQDVVIELLPS